jgi:hypothetical protein
MVITFRPVLYAKSQEWNTFRPYRFVTFPIRPYPLISYIYGTVSLNRDCLHKRGIALSEPASSNGLSLQFSIATFGEFQPPKKISQL